jgi:hypothetical protein
MTDTGWRFYLLVKGRAPDERKAVKKNHGGATSPIPNLSETFRSSTRAARQFQHSLGLRKATE